MSHAAVSVEPLERRDSARAVEVLTSALWDIPSMRFAFEGLADEAVQRRFARGLSSSTAAALAWGRVLCARVDGEVRGAAIAYPPGTWPLPFLRWLRSGLGFLTIGPRPFARLARYDAILNRHHPKEPHWYLYFLGVAPGWQGRGLGGALVRELARLAAADGVPLCLETDKESNVGFYRANGCEITSERRLAEVGGITLWSLRRG